MIVGITFSAFDLLHTGHIVMLKEAKNHCDYLIAGLQVDPSLERPDKNKPIQTLFERYVQLSGCSYVDEVVPYVAESEINDILLSYPINIRFIGEEYRDKPFTGKDICKSANINIFYNTRKHSFSSSSLRKRIQDDLTTTKQP